MADNLFRVNRGLNLNPQASAPISPINGDLYFDDSQKTFVFYDNGFWINLASQVDVAAAASLNSTQFTSAVVQNSLVRITGSTVGTLYGMAASTGGKQVVIYNAGTSSVAIDSNNVGEPTAANRFSMANGFPVDLGPGVAVIAVYDSTQQRWVIASGSGGGGASGIAEEVAIPNAATSINVNFPIPLLSSSYTVIAQMVNSTDVNPQYVPMTITNKTLNGFTASWNAPVDSANYLIDYIVPGVNQQFGEFILSLASISVTVSFPIPLASVNYVVVSEMSNVVDVNPAYIPVTITNKTISSFTARWNAPLDSSNYRLGYNVAEFQS